MSDEQWVSYSQLATLRQCPQKWHYSYVQKLTKDDPEDAKVWLNFGLWWHALRAADSIVRGREHGTLRKYPDELRTMDDGGPVILTREDPDRERLDLEVIRIAERWWAKQSSEVQEKWTETLGQAMPERLVEVDRRYRKHWKGERANEHPVAVEAGWGRRLPTWGDTDPDTRVVGYVDEIYYDARRGILVARDHKSAKSLGTQTVADSMMDSQLQLYAWGISEQVTEWGYDRITATAYDRVTTLAPTQPKLTKAGNLYKNITMFDLDTYLQFAAGPDGKGAPYGDPDPKTGERKRYQIDPKMVEKLDTPTEHSKWFQRELSPLNMNLIKAHLKAAVDSSLDMRRTRERIEEHGEAGRNLTNMCRWCDFASLCRAQMIGGPHGEYNLAEHKLTTRDRLGR